MIENKNLSKHYENLIWDLPKIDQGAIMFFYKAESYC